MSSNGKRSEICIREQFATRMVRGGGEIENGDYEGKERECWTFLVCIYCYDIKPLVS